MNAWGTAHRTRYKGVAASLADAPDSGRGFRFLLVLALVAVLTMTALGMGLYQRRAEKREA